MATVTATVTAYSVPPSVTLVASGGAGTVERMQDGVATTVRGTVAPWAGGTILDYECPQQSPVTYRYAGAVSTLVEMPDVGVWLIPVGQPDLAVQVVVSAHDGWETAAGQDMVRIPGRKFPVVVSWGARGGEVGKFDVTLRTREAEVALVAALAGQSIVLLSTHLNHGLGGYMSIGDVGWSRQVAYSRDEARRVSLQYTMVERPDLVAVPEGHRIIDMVGTIGAAVGTIAQQ